MTGPREPSQADALRQSDRNRARFRRGRLAIISIAFVLCVIAHYVTPYTHENHAWHHIHYLMFFVPILLAGIWFGFRAGLFVALFASVAYFSYAISHGPPVSLALVFQGIFEIVLYAIIGGGLGGLADRERSERARVEAINRELAARTDQLIEAERRLAYAERMSALGRLSASIAHEVRNPLGSIKGSAEILRDDFPTDHPKRQFLDILIKEADRLNAGLDNFLEFARPPSLHIAPVSPRSVLEHVAALIEPQCRREGIGLRVQCDDEEAEIAADERQLQQAILNLVLNSIEAMPRGGELELRCYRTQHGAPAEAIAIADTGSGFTEEQLANAFEPFYSSKANGTGLGLTTVRKIVEAHGGTIRIENRSDEPTGAVVTIALPLGRADRPGPTPQEVEHASS